MVISLIEMLRKNAESLPSKAALVYEEVGYTYTDLYDKVSLLARFMRNRKIGQKDRVALFMDRKSPELVVTFLAAAWCGGVIVPIDCNQPVESIRQLVSMTSPSMAVLSDTLTEKAELAGMHEVADCLVTVGDTGEAKDFIGFNEALEKGRNAVLPSESQISDIVYLNLTSGTTGLPKCAVTTHDNLYWNTAAAVKDLELTPGDIHLSMFPPSTHPHELFARALYLGGTAVLTDHIAPKTLTRVIEKNRVTAMMAIAPIYGNLVRCHRKDNFYFSTLRLAESGGMHLDPVIAGDFKERFRLPIVPVWGSTETTGVAVVTPLHKSFRTASCGRVSSFYEAKIVDENGRELEAGEVGEMVMKGRGVCSGYYNNQEETETHFRGDWYWTGDMFKKDEEGYFYFQGRKNGMMKVGGMKAFPVEIEDCLIRHPGIKEVAVVKETNSSYGEIPKAVVVPEDGAALDKKEIRQYCEVRLAKHKVPKKIEFVRALPRTPMGKILQKELSA